MSKAIDTLPEAGVPLREKIAYGCGDLSSTLMWGMTSSYLMYFYPYIDGLPVTAVAWILLVARTFDAFCDPAVGWLLDRKGGIIIPKIIGRLSIAFGVTGFLCFYTPPFSPHLRIFWAAVTYIIFGAIYSFINTPYGALGTMMTRSIHHRVGLNAFRMMGCQSGQIIISSLTIPAILWLGGGTDLIQRQQGTTRYAFILALTSIALWTVVSRNCHVRYPTPPTKQNFLRILKYLLNNRTLWLCNSLVFLQFMGLASLYGFSLYYARVVLGGSENLGSIILTIATITGFLGALFSQYINNILGFRKTFISTIFLQILCYTSLLIGNFHHTLFFCFFSLLTGSQGIASPLYFTLLSSAIDDGLKKTGVNTTGIAYSLNTLVTKFSMGITGFILAFLLSYGHYTADKAVFSINTQKWISDGFLGLPLVAACLQFGLIVLWPRKGALGSVRS